jgi:hypothetical protein
MLINDALPCFGERPWINEFLRAHTLGNHTKPSALLRIFRVELQTMNVRQQLCEFLGTAAVGVGESAFEPSKGFSNRACTR